MPDHIQLKRYDNNLVSLAVLLHATNKQNSSTFPRDTCNLLFWRTQGMPGHA